MLPHKGGKIPDTAFHSDRLALNRLQKEGIAIPDGVILEQRNPKVLYTLERKVQKLIAIHNYFFFFTKSGASVRSQRSSTSVQSLSHIRRSLHAHRGTVFELCGAIRHSGNNISDTEIHRGLIRCECTTIGVRLSSSLQIILVAQCIAAKSTFETTNRCGIFAT